ncbi:MAG: hypothetical protein ACMXYM_05325 [Candidatus Woesearchaeota archaeon]
MRGRPLLIILLVASLLAPAAWAEVSHPADEIRGGVFGGDFGIENYTFPGTVNFTNISFVGQNIVITGFSADELLGGFGANNVTLPTQWAIKRYVDSQIFGGSTGWLTSEGLVRLANATDTVNATTLYVDNVAERVGIGTDDPTRTLDVSGTARISGALYSGMIAQFGVQPTRQVAVGLQNELAYWNERGGTLTVENTSNISVSGAANALRPHLDGGTSGEVTVIVDEPGVVSFEFSSLPFPTRSENTQSAYLQMRAGLSPSNILVEVYNGTEWTIVWDEAFSTTNGLWLSSEADWIAWGGVEPEAVRYNLTYTSTGTSRISTIGLHKRSIPLGLNIYPFLGASNVFTAQNAFLGDVGVGTTSPDGRLTVRGGLTRIGAGGTPDVASGEGDLYVDNTIEVNGSLVVRGEIITAGNSHLALMPHGSGNVGIGTTTPSAELEVVGDIELSGKIEHTSSGVVQEFENGCTMTANSTGLYWNC